MSEAIKFQCARCGDIHGVVVEADRSFRTPVGWIYVIEINTEDATEKVYCSRACMREAECK